LWTFREPSLCRHVHRECMRNALRNFTPMIPTTACYQRDYAERYSKYIPQHMLTDALCVPCPLLCRFQKDLTEAVGINARPDDNLRHWIDRQETPIAHRLQGFVRFLLRPEKPFAQDTSLGVSDHDHAHLIHEDRYRHGCAPLPCGGSCLTV